MKNILIIIILSLLLYDFVNSKPPIPPPVINIPEEKELTREQILDYIKVSDVKKYVEDLSSKEFEGRGTGSKGNEKAAEYICKHLDSLKIPYQKQTFSVRGTTTSNIIAYIEPKNITNKENLIVIGAHFDHLGSRGSSYYPGADDNASGTAGLMAIATALSKFNNLKYPVSLQFYSAEELGLIGSEYYTNNPLFPVGGVDIKKHIAMINLDMIGYLRSKYNTEENTTTYRDEKNYTIFEYTNNVDLKSIVKNLSSKYPFANNISGYRPGGSDHAPFYRKGIPVVFLHTGSHPHYHQTSDTADKLNYDGLVLVSKLALEILLNIN